MKTWKLKEKFPEELAEKLRNVNALSLQLLYNRGLTEEKEILEFLNPKYESLHDPFLFMDLEKAVDRIWQAIEKEEGICIYGDYDADAVTANAVLQQTFRYLGVEVSSYIPDRFTEGYGVNLDALSKIKDQGCKIIITVDCGTNSTDAAEFCAKNGIDFIITDHHEIIGELPKAFALINPKNPNDKYPYSEITGVGVAFKFACGILSQRDKVLSRIQQPLSPALAARAGHSPLARGDKKGNGFGYEKWLLDLVAIGTVADCHSLLGENRLLVSFGLKVLAKSRWTGLKALAASAGLDFTTKIPDTYTLGFIIAPRLNAAGRLEHANVALHLLMEKDPISAQQKAQALEQINARRQDLTLRVVSEAREQAEKILDRKVLVLAGDDWPKGIVGLVAGKIAEEYYKPTFVLSKEGNEATGSARTVGEFDVVEALKYASKNLTRFGGHKQAAGLTLETKNLDNFYQQLLDYAEKNVVNGDRVLHLDAELEESQLSIVTCQMLQSFSPFGVGNPAPKFLISGLEVVGVRTVGKQLTHLQLQLKKGNTKISAIGFGFGAFAKNLNLGNTIDVAGELIEDGWNGRREVKIRIVDIRKVNTDIQIS
jgi:single-stranded-DNA-specific exonuclease